MNKITLDDLMFPTSGKLIAQGQDIYLKMIHPNEKAAYISLSKSRVSM